MDIQNTLVNSDELIAEALTFYASDLRQQAEFCAYMMDTDGMNAAREKVYIIEQLMQAHDNMNAKATTTETSEAPDPVLEAKIEEIVNKNPVGFTSQKIKPQASPKNPKPVVGMPRQPWDVV